MFTKKKNCLSQVIFVPPSFIVAGARSGTLYRWVIPEKWESTTIYPSFETTVHIGEVSVMHWGAELRLLFTGSADRTVMIWSISGKQPPQRPLQTLRAFQGTPLSITTYQRHLFVAERSGISVFTQQALKGTSDEKVVFKKVAVIKAEQENLTCLCFSPNPSVDNSGYLYAGFDNGAIVQYDAQLSEKPSFIESNRSIGLRGKSKPKVICDNAIFKIEYIHKEGIILVFSYDRHIRFFNPRNYRVVNIFMNPRKVDFVSAIYDPISLQYILTDADGFIYVWEVTETVRALLQTQYKMRCQTIVDGPPGYFLFLVREGAYMLDINRGTVKTSYQIHSGTVFYIRSIEDSGTTLLVTAGDDRNVRFWDAHDFSPRLEHKAPTNLAILSAYVGVRERQGTNLIWVVTGHDEGKLFFANITDHKVAELPSKHKNSISSLSVVEKDTNILLFACDYDGVVSMWSIDSLLENISYAAVSLVKIWKAHTSEILASSGQWLVENIFATGGNDRVIKIWREVDGTFTDTQLVGHTDSVTALVFDGFFLFSGSEDCTIRIWDTVNFVQLLVVTQLHSAAIRSISIIDGESKVASSDASGAIYIYDYLKKVPVWNTKHLNDCRCFHIEKSMNKLYACVKTELIPHAMPDIFSKTHMSISPYGSMNFQEAKAGKVV